MFEITVTTSFHARHALRLPDGSLEPAHAHDWQVRVTVAAPGLDTMECVMDFHVLEKRVQEIIAPARATGDLNCTPPFGDEDGRLQINPSAERVAWWIGAAVSRTLPAGVSLMSVTVTEAPGCLATYRP